MKIDFDSDKNDENIAKRGLYFAFVADFDWSTVKLEKDSSNVAGRSVAQSGSSWHGNPYCATLHTAYIFIS